MKIGTGRRELEGLGVDDLLWNEPYLVLRTALFAPQYGLFCLSLLLNAHSRKKNLFTFQNHNIYNLQLQFASNFVLIFIEIL